MSRWRGARSVTSRSPIAIDPAVTSSRPAIMRRSVDLPQPDGPTRTTNSPSSIASDTSFTARTPPAYSFDTCSRAIPATARWYSPHRRKTRPEPDRSGEMVLTSGRPPHRLPQMDERPVTEARNAVGADLDLRSTAELVELMNREDAHVPGAVAEAFDEIAVVVDEVVARLHRGGRLVYSGAGTSGRLAELDADECEATFGAFPQVVAVVAGAGAESTEEREAAEDDEAAGARALEALQTGPDDAVIVVS